MIMYRWKIIDRKTGIMIRSGSNFSKSYVIGYINEMVEFYKSLDVVIRVEFDEVTERNGP